VAIAQLLLLGSQTASCRERILQGTPHTLSFTHFGSKLALALNDEGEHASESDSQRLIINIGVCALIINSAAQQVGERQSERVIY
jgi:hypothetical protein